MKTANFPAQAAIGFGLLALWHPIAAQTAAPAASAPGVSTATLTPMQRAQRDADRVYYWIKLHGKLPGKLPEKAPPVRDAATGSATKPAAVPSTAAAKRPAALERNADPAPPAGGAEPTATERVTAETNEPPSDAPSATTPQADAPIEPAAPAEPALVSPLAAEPAAPAQPPERSPEPQVPIAAEPAAAPQNLAPAIPAEERLLAIAQPAPNFPTALIERLRRGSVRVQLSVLPDGSVASAEVLESSHERLNPVALAAVRQWGFKPVARAQVAQVELAFKLD